MQLFIDQMPHTFRAAPETTVAQLLASMRSELLGAGRLVTAALWGGEPVSPAVEAELYKTTVVGPGLLELTSSPAQEVAVGLLRQVGRIFEPLQLQQNQIAGHLAAGRTGEAMGDLAIYVEAWQNAQNALAACGRLMRWRYEKMRFAEQTVEQHFEALAEQLRNIRDALESQDFVTLADVLTYELNDTLGLWAQMLDYLAHQAGRAAPQPA
jgi:hypothetical protein